METYAGVSVENVHVVSCIEIIDGTLTIDFESI